MKHARDLGPIVDRLRDISRGVPVGVKIAAGNQLERDLELAVNAGVDFVWVDGAEAGTHGSLPIFEDDFVLPTLYALIRAADFWEQHGSRGEVTLIIGGGLFTPGAFLKALALGADAVGIGTAAIYAITHSQLHKTLPFEPRVELITEGGKYSRKFDPDKGAKYLANFLDACMFEIERAVRVLGKTAIKEVNRSDLITFDDKIAQIADIALGYRKHR